MHGGWFAKMIEEVMLYQQDFQNNAFFHIRRNFVRKNPPIIKSNNQNPSFT